MQIYSKSENTNRVLHYHYWGGGGVLKKKILKKKLAEHT